MPTTNPVPSQDPSDLLFNAGKLDEVLNGTGNSFTDRLGVARRTVAGMNADFDAQLADAESDLNVYRADAAASAAQALGYLNTIRTTSYGAYASDPATDPLGNPPNAGDEYFNTTSNLLKRFNGATWQASDINTANLAAPNGSSLIGYDTGTVQDVLDGAKSLQDYAALRAYTGRANRIYITGLLATVKPAGIAGVFQYDPTDTTSADNGGTIIVGADGRRWKRDFTGAVHVKWFGAIGNKIANDTQSIQNALDSGYKDIDISDGEYCVTSLTINYDYITIFGSGQGGHLSGGSRLISIGTGTDVIYARQRYKLTFKNFRIETAGGRNNRDGFHLDGCVWTIFDTVHIHQMGRHGVFCEDTGTIYSGCYPVIVNKCHIVGCAGDGINIVGKSGAGQMNGIYLSNCELQACNGSGAVLWGTNVVVRDNIIEGNTQYGIKLANGLSSGVYSAEAVTLDSNYFEKNSLGSIYGEVGQRGAIVGLRIAGNLGVFDEEMQATYVPVKFVATGTTSENAIRGLDYRSNSFHSSSTGALSSTEADFTNAPNSGSVINNTQGVASTSSFILFAQVARFINLGYAQIETGIKTKVLSGLLQAKGGSGIAYSGLDKSDNIAVSGSNTYFPVDVPIGTRIDRYQIPVDTDSTNYTIRFQLLKKSNDALGAYGDMHNITKQTLAAGPTLVKTGSILQYTTNPRKDAADEADTILNITVMWSVAPTYFYIGNPTVFHS